MTLNKQINTGLPIVAIVGKPNVGKSSLFNRLINQRYAITSEIAGTTRDRIYFRAEFNSLTVVLVDTGGLEYGKKDSIEADVQTQVDLAIDEADLIFFVVDAKEGLTIEDHKAAEKLRKAKKKIIFIANKIDNKSANDNIIDTYKLGFGEPLEISAYHNIGISSITDEAEDILLKQGWHAISNEEQSRSKETINICFLGKPNVGKSSLVNALLGKEKVIVSEIPGTTRDAIDTEVAWEDQKYNLIDTAGLRRRGKIERGLEKLSSFRSLEAIERSDIVCLILDYSEGIRKQDQHISSYIQEAGKGIILVVNKVDLMEERQNDEQKTISILRRRFDFLPWAPILFVSALKRTNLEKIMELSREIYKERFKKIDDEELNL
ncbi:ribosome biogenesis GTPase Der, partial [Patescibacteria group bacterium]|nr:ribosome biogenesis GTPase Der [Patescibacteria group bacterium]